MPNATRVMLSVADVYGLLMGEDIYPQLLFDPQTGLPLQLSEYPKESVQLCDKHGTPIDWELIPADLVLVFDLMLMMQYTRIRVTLGGKEYDLINCGNGISIEGYTPPPEKD